MASESFTFEELLLRAIDEGLEKVLGEKSAKAVKFYIEPRMAIYEPDAYARSLEKMFRNDGARVIIVAITEKLCEYARMQRREWGSLTECIDRVKRNVIGA